MFKNKEDYENYLEEVDDLLEKTEKHENDIEPFIRSYFKILHDLGEISEPFHEFNKRRSSIGIEKIEFEPNTVSVVFYVYEGCGESSYHEKIMPVNYILDDEYRENFKKEKEQEILDKKMAKQREKEERKKAKENLEYQTFLELKNKFENTNAK